MLLELELELAATIAYRRGYACGDPAGGRTVTEAFLIDVLAAMLVSV